MGEGESGIFRKWLRMKNKHIDLNDGYWYHLLINNPPPKKNIVDWFYWSMFKEHPPYKPTPTQHINRPKKILGSRVIGDLVKWMFGEGEEK